MGCPSPPLRKPKLDSLTMRLSSAQQCDPAPQPMQISEGCNSSWSCLKPWRTTLFFVDYTTFASLDPGNDWLGKAEDVREG